jgi:hypothetical protein
MLSYNYVAIKVEMPKDNVSYRDESWVHSCSIIIDHEQISKEIFQKADC